MSDDELVIHARNREALCLYAWHPCLYNPQLKNWLGLIRRADAGSVGRERPHRHPRIRKRLCRADPRRPFRADRGGRPPSRDRAAGAFRRAGHRVSAEIAGDAFLTARAGCAESAARLSHRPSRIRRKPDVSIGSLPLSRFTVLDLTHARAGPTAVRQLADWGAKVIKIEPPGGAGQRHHRLAPRGVRFPEPAPQQAQPRAQPEKPGRQGDLYEAGREGRCDRREFPLRGEVPPRRRLRIRQEGQQAHRLWQHLRLRPDRAVCEAARGRSDRAGDGRA